MNPVARHRAATALRVILAAAIVVGLVTGAFW
jgi:hypothetical protein